MKIAVYSPTIRRKEMDAVLTALVEDKIGPGEQERVLLRTARDFLGFEQCVALRSPAMALALALKTLGLAAGSGVLLSALSPRYYRLVIEDSGLCPRYVDVAPSQACITRRTIEAALSACPNPPGCILIHHTLGYAPDTEALAETGLPVIEDISQSYGTLAGERIAGSVGALTILGLEEQDMLTAGGGALLFAPRKREGAALRNQGNLPKEYGLPDMNAALAIVQFRESEKNLAKRKEIAQAYIRSSLRTRHKTLVRQDGESYNHYAFPLILATGTGVKEVKAYARQKDIPVENAFGNEDTLVEAAGKAACPEAYALSLRTVRFPLYPRLGASEVEKVAKLIGSLP
ncbi:MAG: DegT/DnrJ/EryC1/StrS family aminotransferase [Spirochaetaceae bacterium]|jgi:dTDP-4-amino-4,6-dideoxygalactose transaminase|nr:DegT/DnrJ/EryC1/StrS family aminotransferase [Spirochaetaceae bacterium]